MREIFREIEIGGLSKEQLITRLEEADVHFNKYATTLFEHPNFASNEKVARVKLVKVSFVDLDLRNPCSFDNVLGQAIRQGLKPCPLSLAAYFRLQFLDQAVGPYITIASPRPEVDESYPTGFYLRNFETKLWLRGYRVDGEPEWPAENEFVFML